LLGLRGNLAKLRAMAPLAVATLEHAKVLEALAAWLPGAVGRQDVIVLLMGLLSAIVDNIPMVAAAMGMYPLSKNPADSFLCEFMRIAQEPAARS
jgi:Na+/H+ antiporter NhaD/arsenite permease-like protein